MKRNVKPKKDPDHELPIATPWRPVLKQVVGAFVKADYRLASGVPDVAPISAAKARQIRAYLKDYGETLVELADDTWKTSISRWMEDYWEVLVDLWTEESGRSDMVLSARVYETKVGFRFEVLSVHVP